MKRHRYLRNVATLILEADSCVGCKKCVQVCPHGVFAIKEKKMCIAHKNYCMECGACALNCPAGAIKVAAGVGCASFFINKWFRGSESCCGTERDCC